MAVKKEFSSFQELLQTTNLPVLVDFYATWCGPCQMMAPILEQTGMYFKNRLQIVKIDTDKYPNLATKYGIQALPTLVVFKNGQPIDRIEGVVQVNQLVQHLQTAFTNFFAGRTKYPNFKTTLTAAFTNRTFCIYMITMILAWMVISIISVIPTFLVIVCLFGG